MRELEVYCEIHPYHNIPEITSDVKGVILSGSPFSVNQEESPRIDFSKFLQQIPQPEDFNNIKEEGFELIQQSKTKTDFRIALNYILYLDNQNRTSNIAYDPFN